MEKDKLNEYSSATPEGRNNLSDELFNVWKEIPKEKTMSDEEFNSITDEIYASMSLEEQMQYTTDWYLRNRQDISIISKNMLKDAAEYAKQKGNVL